MKINIVIPMKDPQESKQRLAQVLKPSHRERLALSLFIQTLGFLRREFPDYPLLVVTASARIRAIAQSFSAKVLLERRASGLNGAAEQAAAWSRAHGFDAQLLLPADIAVLDREELSRLLQHRCQGPSVVICPADDGGTNALLTSPPDVLPFRYGPRSSRAHLADALARGVPCALLKMSHLAFDVDTPCDLQQLALLPQSIPAQEVLSLWNHV